jgi:hypothetical protein
LESGRSSTLRSGITGASRRGLIGRSRNNLSGLSDGGRVAVPSTRQRGPIPAGWRRSRRYAESMAQTGLQLGGAGDGATKALHETVIENNEVTSRQTAELIRLTRWIVRLTVVLALGLVLQIVLAIIG